MDSILAFLNAHRPPPRTNQELLQAARENLGIAHDHPDNCIPEGLLYVVHNVAHQRIGFLYGTNVQWNPHWDRLSPKVYHHLQEATDVYVELDTRQSNFQELPQVTIEILDHAQGKNVHCLDSVEELSSLINLSQNSHEYEIIERLAQAERLINKGQKLIAICQEQSTAWSKGDAAGVNARVQQFRSELDDQPLYLKMYRAQKWFNRDLCSLVTAPSPQTTFFIAVESSHLFDIGHHESITPGLLSLFQKQGASLTQISSLQEGRVNPPTFRRTNQEILHNLQIRKLHNPNVQSDIAIGLLYEVQNSSSQSVGYLFGTFHTWDPKWRGLNPKVYQALDESHDVYMESDIRSFPQHHAQTPFIDLEIFDRSQDKSLMFLESPFEAISTGIWHTLTMMLEDGKKVEKSNENNLLTAWEIGDDLKFASHLQNEYDDLSKLEAEEAKRFRGLFQPSKEKTNEFRNVFDRRNTQWFERTITHVLTHSSEKKKFFIGVGAGHLFDIQLWDGEIGPGLITLTQGQRFSVRKVPTYAQVVDLSKA